MAELCEDFTIALYELLQQLKEAAEMRDGPVGWQRVQKLVDQYGIEHVIKYCVSDPEIFFLEKLIGAYQLDLSRDLGGIWGGTILHHLAATKQCPSDDQKKQKRLYLISKMATTDTVNLQNQNGQTPLHLAYIAKDDEVVVLLLEKGANEGIKDNQGCVPIYYWPAKKLEKACESLQISYEKAHLRGKNKSKEKLSKYQPITPDFSQDWLSLAHAQKAISHADQKHKENINSSNVDDKSVSKLFKGDKKFLFDEASPLYHLAEFLCQKGEDCGEIRFSSLIDNSPHDGELKFKDGAIIKVQITRALSDEDGQNEGLCAELLSEKGFAPGGSQKINAEGSQRNRKFGNNTPRVQILSDETILEERLYGAFDKKNKKNVIGKGRARLPIRVIGYL